MPSRSLPSSAAALVRAMPGVLPTFLIVALLACMLVPLPTPLVDLLLSLSLSGSVLLLVACIVVRRPTEILSFPTLLLLATLYRLALNLSTTRLILSQADAGRVIDAFAGFVVRDDLVVGGVMFLIITLVQYLVIAKGAERVAEVGARFALDGLPGHQAAIDADLRAKVISPREASSRRARLAERSGFYGAMDGAMRFVRGDAIAGLAITAVNLLGGLAVGVGRMGWSWRESLDVYGRLTIGDGLLAQIPALLVSLAAGVLVARVDTEDTSRARSLHWLDPAMLVVPAVLLLGLAAVPQMPTLAFLTTAAALLTAALLLTSRADEARPEPTSDRIAVVLSPRVAESARGLERTLAEVRLRCVETLRIAVPEVELVVDRDQPATRVDVRHGDRTLVRAALSADEDAADAIVLVVFRALMDEAATFCDLQTLERELDEVRATQPAVVEQALDGIDLVDVLTVVRGLARERVPRPPLAAILAVLAENKRLRDPAERGSLPELVRHRLAAHFAHEVLDSVARLGAVRWVRPTLDAEEELGERLIVGADGAVLALSPGERQGWLARIRGSDAAGPATPGSADASRTPPIVVLTTSRGRRAFAELFVGVAPHVTVLSTAELDAARIPPPADSAWAS